MMRGRSQSEVPPRPLGFGTDNKPSKPAARRPILWTVADGPSPDALVADDVRSFRNELYMTDLEVFEPLSSFSTTRTKAMSLDQFRPDPAPAPTSGSATVAAPVRALSSPLSKGPPRPDRTTSGASSTVPTASSARSSLSARSSRARARVAAAEACVVMSGYVRMREATRGWRMKTAYWALHRARLHFYASQADAALARELRGRVGVVGAQPSPGHGTFRVYPHAFTVETTRGDVYFCAAPSAFERARWVQEINAAARARGLLPGLDDASSEASHVTSSRGSSGSLSGEGDGEAPATSTTTAAAAALTTMTMESPGDVLAAVTATSCFDCGVSFGLLRRHRRHCQSCARAFCRRHCSRRMVLGTDAVEGAPGRPVRVCDGCAYRQHFVAFVETFTARAIGMLRQDTFNIAPREATTSAFPELAVLLGNPATFTVLNVLCLLKKYLGDSRRFTQALCALIPLYERDPSALEEAWIQFLGIFVPLLRTKEPFSPAMQFFLRFIFGVCRRSNAFALRTLWECLAFYEDARARDDHATMSYLMLLIYSTSAFDGSSAYVAAKLLGHAPRHQVDATLAAMDEFLEIRSVLRHEIPNSLPARWFNSFCPHEMEASRDLVLAALEGITNEPTTLVAVFDPAFGDYLKLLRARGVTLPPSATSMSPTSRDDGGKCPHGQADDRFMAQKERNFDAQAAFVERLTRIADTLRVVTPIEKREEMLRELLVAAQESHIRKTRPRASSTRPTIEYPLSALDDPPLSILRILPAEAQVFSTRTRAPTMIVFEVSSPDEEGGRNLPSTTSHESVKRVDSKGVLARKDSHMLDVMLVGFRNTDGDIELGKLCSSDSVDMDNNAHENNRVATRAMAPPKDFMMEEAREQYLDSTSSFQYSFTGLQSNSRMEMSWKRKIEKIKKRSEFSCLEGWTLKSLIAKSHDDLRQEVFAMQLMRALMEIFQNNNLVRLYLQPYRIVCTGANVGLIETVEDATSIDALKKKHGSIAQYFEELHGRNQASPAYIHCRDAFIQSMAASSLYCYLFQVKDRHNGNIMMDTSGHIIHIDFGFIMGIAPGGKFSLEESVPFKLTQEMVDLMGGQASHGFQEFKTLFAEGFMAVRCEYIKLVTLIHLTAEDSPFPCFQNQTPRQILDDFRRRLFLKDNDDRARQKALRLIDKSFNNWGTRQYDKFQFASNGILP